MTVCPAKTRISLGIHPVGSGVFAVRSMCTYPCEKKLAFLQLLRSSEAAEKLRKSFLKAGGIGTCGKAGFNAGLLKSCLLRSFYATLQKSCGKACFSTAFTKLYAELHKNSHDEQKLRKRSNYAGANIANFCMQLLRTPT